MWEIVVWQNVSFLQCHSICILLCTFMRIFCQFKYILVMHNSCYLWHLWNKSWNPGKSHTYLCVYFRYKVVLFLNFTSAFEIQIFQSFCMKWIQMRNSRKGWAWFYPCTYFETRRKVYLKCWKHAHNDYPFKKCNSWDWFKSI